MELFKGQNFILNFGQGGNGIHKNGYWIRLTESWLQSVKERKRVRVRITLSTGIHLPWMTCMLAFLVSEFLVFCGGKVLEIRGSCDISVVLVTMFWSVVLVHIRWRTRGLVCLRFTWPGTESSDPDSSFLAGIENCAQVRVELLATVSLASVVIKQA